MESFKRFGKEKLPDKRSFYSSVKNETTGDNGEKLDGHINDKIIWHAKSFGMDLTWKIWVIIMNNIWKQMFCY